MANPASTKLGTTSGVYVPVVLNILSILMFLRFGSILGSIGLLGFLTLLFIAYLINLATALSLSAIASNGEVKGGGAYFLISRSLGPEFGGSIGILFYLSQVLNTSLNIVGLVDCLKLNLPDLIPPGYWLNYGVQSCAMVVCTALCLAGSAIFARASNGLLLVLLVSTASIVLTALARTPYNDDDLGIHFTGLSLDTLRGNIYPANPRYGVSKADVFRAMFGVLFPATSGIFAGASMSGDLRNPSKSIPRGTLWAMLSTLVLYLTVILAMASSTTHNSFIRSTNVIYETSIWPPAILAGECATTFFSALMGLMGAAKLLQALARDKLLPGLSIFGKGAKKTDDPIFAVLVTFTIAQLALFAELNQIATLIAMGYQMTFFVMNLACFLLKIGSAPNFRPAFKFFNWQTAFIGSLLSAFAMFFIDETYAASAICLLVFLFLLIHYMSPPKHWGDVSQNLIYHQVRKYLLRLKPEHIKFWRPQIILLVNDPRHHTRLIQFCNSMKKGALYILGHVIVTDNFNSGIHEAKLQQSAWTQYISEFSRIKAFVQLNMSPSIEWGVRNLILSAGLGGMRPNIAVLGFYNMDDLRLDRPDLKIISPGASENTAKSNFRTNDESSAKRRRGDTSARLLGGLLPTDSIKTESSMSPTSYMTIVEDLALRNRLNVAIGKGFQTLETPRCDGSNTKRFIDLWPIQMSAEITAGDRNFLTTNFDTYTLILQLGYILQSVPTWKSTYRLRVLVFVEYENEIEEERLRLRTLLDKLRIDARILVFALASGQLSTYEMIVNGTSNDPAVKERLQNTLKTDEWWRELCRLRGQTSLRDEAQNTLSFGELLERNRRRSSSPRIGAEGLLGRRHSHGDQLDIPKNPTVSTLSRMGVNLGIHTHQLGMATADRSGRPDIDYFALPDDPGDESGTSESELSDVDFNDETSFPELEDAEVHLSGSHGIRRRFSILTGARRSRSATQPAALSSPSQNFSNDTQHERPSGYGTINSMAAPRPHGGPKSHLQRLALSSHAEDRAEDDSASPKFEPRKAADVQTSLKHGPVPTRPSLSRHASATRSTSQPTSDPKPSHDDGDLPRISLANPEPKVENVMPEATPKRPSRPGLSRNPSAAKFSSGLVPELVTLEGSADDSSRLGFVEAASASEPQLRATITPRRTPNHSRKNSGMAQFSTKDHKHYEENSRPESSEGPNTVGSGPDVDEPANRSEEDDTMSGDDFAASYATQALPLSFNDLPSSAQHLVLNELMRRESRDSAVLFTTLPIPEEGTCEDEEASVKYLSDIEVLCEGLPPTLLVLSNNMTVTVSL